MVDISASAFYQGRPPRTTQVPVLSSVGCPYTCDFCVDWNNSYVRVPAERLRADLDYLSRRWPRVLVRDDRQPAPSNSFSACRGISTRFPSAFSGP